VAALAKWAVLPQLDSGAIVGLSLPSRDFGEHGPQRKSRCANAIRGGFYRC